VGIRERLPDDAASSGAPALRQVRDRAVEVVEAVLGVTLLFILMTVALILMTVAWALALYVAIRLLSRRKRR
jgi:hypothetical protein